MNTILDQWNKEKAYTPYEHLAQEIGQILKAKRIEMGLTQKELCQETCIDLSTYKRVESGYQFTNFYNIFKLINYLQIEDFNMVKMNKPWG